MEASGLTTEKILKDTLLGSIPFYLQPGETIESMVKSCEGSLIKTIQFLRERSYKDLELVKRPAQVRKVVKEKEPEDNIIHPKHDFVPAIVSDKLPPATPSKKSPNKKPATKPSQSQQNLF